MRILIVYPAVVGLNNGNLVTAERWRQCLSALGHTVEVAARFDVAVGAGNAPDLMIALHAIKSSDAIRRCRDTFANVPIVVVLTGTDLYGDQSATKMDPMLALADRIVVLQSATADDVGSRFCDKVRVIHQAVAPLSHVSEKSSDHFDVCVVGHLRQVKDPFRAAEAASAVPRESKIRVTQIGAAMTDPMREMATQLDRDNPRFRWAGELPHEEALERIASSHLLVNSSRIEGGAAVICEAVVAGTPILATRIPGNIGFLGEDYEGLFDVGDTQQLRALLLTAENNIDFYQRLKEHCENRSYLFAPEREKRKWAELIGEFEV